MPLTDKQQNKIFKNCLHEFSGKVGGDYFDHVDEDWFDQDGLKEYRGRILAIFEQFLTSDKDHEDVLKTSITNLLEFIADLMFGGSAVESTQAVYRKAAISTKSDLEDLKSDLESGLLTLGKSAEVQSVYPSLEWGTANTIITSDPDLLFGPDDRCIFTRHAPAVVWLLMRLKTIYRDAPWLYLPNVDIAVAYLEDHDDDSFDTNELMIKMIDQTLEMLHTRD